MRYPGFGGIVSIVLAEGALAADLLTHKTKLWVHATSLGGVESTFERRRRWKTEPATIPDGLVRLSVGIEDVEDLWRDLCRPSTPSPDRLTASRNWTAVVNRRDRPPFRDRVTSGDSAMRSVGLGLGVAGDEGVHQSWAVIRPATTASTCWAIGASTPDCSASARSEEQDFAPSAT